MSLIDAIMRVVFGHNAIDNVTDWHQVHKKAKASREDLNNTIKEAELLQAAKKYEESNQGKDKS